MQERGRMRHIAHSGPLSPGATACRSNADSWKTMLSLCYARWTAGQGPSVATGPALAAPRTAICQTPDATSHIAKRVSLSRRARWGAMLEVTAQPGRDALAVLLVAYGCSAEPQIMPFEQTRERRLSG